MNPGEKSGHACQVKLVPHWSHCVFFMFWHVFHPIGLYAHRLKQLILSLIVCKSSFFPGNRLEASRGKALAEHMTELDQLIGSYKVSD